MEMIDFDCAQCGHPLRVLPRHAGGKVRCPYCKAVIMAPEMTPAPEPEPPVAQAAPPEPQRRKEPPKDGRIFCPHCGERIWPDAPKCRYCGQGIGEHASRHGPRTFNPWAVISLLLLVVVSTIASVAAGIVMKSFVAGLIAGGVVCAVATVTAIYGIVFAVRRRAGGIGTSLFCVVSGVLGVGLTILALMGTHELANVAKGISPGLAALIDPSSVPEETTMICSACGHTESVPSKDIGAQQLKSVGDVLKMYGDPNAGLDSIERKGGTGMTCSACGKNTLYPAITCEKCGKPFLSPMARGRLELGEITCPHCGAVQETLGAYGLPKDLLDKAGDKSGDLGKLLEGLQ